MQTGSVQLSDFSAQYQSYHTQHMILTHWRWLSIPTAAHTLYVFQLTNLRKITITTTTTTTTTTTIIIIIIMTMMIKLLYNGN